MAPGGGMRESPRKRNILSLNDAARQGQVPRGVAR